MLHPKNVGQLFNELYGWVMILLLLTDYPRCSWLFNQKGINYNTVEKYGYNRSLFEQYTQPNELRNYSDALNLTIHFYDKSKWLFVSDLSWTENAERLQDAISDREDHIPTCDNLLQTWGPPNASWEIGSWDDWYDPTEYGSWHGGLFNKKNDQHPYRSIDIYHELFTTWGDIDFVNDRFEYFSIIIDSHYKSLTAELFYTTVVTCYCQMNSNDSCYTIDSNGDKKNLLSASSLYIRSNEMSTVAEMVRLIMWLISIRYVAESLYRQYVKNESNGKYLEIYDIVMGSNISVTVNGIAAMIDFNLSMNAILSVMEYSLLGLQIYPTYIALMYGYRLVWIQLFLGKVIKMALARLNSALTNKPRCFNLFLYQESMICISYWLIVGANYVFTFSYEDDYIESTEIHDYVKQNGILTSEFDYPSPYYLSLNFGLPWFIYYVVCNIILSFTIMEKYQSNPAMETLSQVHGYCLIPQGRIWNKKNVRNCLVEKKRIDDLLLHLLRFEEMIFFVRLNRAQYMDYCVDHMADGDQTIAECKSSSTILMQKNNVSKEIKWIGKRNTGSLRMRSTESKKTKDTTAEKKDQLCDPAAVQLSSKDTK
jgi:hypothetical protein